MMSGRLEGSRFELTPWYIGSPQSVDRQNIEMRLRANGRQKFRIQEQWQIGDAIS